MIADPAFVNRPKEFWAHVRLLSQEIGYVERVKRQKGVKGQTGPIKVPTLAELKAALESLGLRSDHLVDPGAKPTQLARDLLDYFDYRARILNGYVQPRLMTAEQARHLFNKLRKQLKAKREPPKNKQTGKKKKPAYFTGIVNMLIEASIGGLPCDYDPAVLTTITKHDVPFRTLARRIDGAFPAPINPIAVWEIKEYYYTTTFGSRVADGVYKSLLDGLELEELRLETKNEISVQHYLMVDAHYTWWVKGRSYLCRIIDMLHMGYVDEVLFGSEVEQRMPDIVRQWVNTARARQGPS
jgi:hypothetical protein